MSRFIDIEVIQNNIKEFCKDLIDKGKYCVEVTEFNKQIQGKIEDLVTADDTNVKHGGNMTPQEALYHLREWYKRDKTGEVDSSACVVAFNALEKQIPPKPDYEGDGYDENGNLIYDTAYCPSCNHEFEEGINDWGCAFCQDCGQALDWGE